MRIDFADLRQLVAGLASSSIASLPAIGAVAVAVLIVLYALWPADEMTADAVVVSGPAFKPVTQTRPAPSPAAASYETGESFATPYDDAASLTRDVQQKLKRAGCYAGPVNGVWSNTTRRSMQQFASLLNARLPVDHPDPVLLALLETNPDAACTAAPAARKGEVATIETGSAAEDARAPSGPADVTRDASPDAEDLGFSSEDRRPPNPIASVQAASAENADSGIEEAAALSAAGAAGVAAHEATKPKRVARKYRKKNSFSRQVSKGLKSLQRSFNKLF